MLRLLLILILSVPVPPTGTLTYSVVETFGSERYSGTYNVTITRLPNGYKITENRNVESEGSETVIVENSTLFGPGLLKYPLLFFDPQKLMDSIRRLVDRILNERNGTRGNYSINIQHAQITLGSEVHDATVVYVQAERMELNTTTTLEAKYRLVNDMGLTYICSFKVYGQRSYELYVHLVRPEESGEHISPRPSVAVLLLGLTLTIILARLLVWKHRRTRGEVFQWLATS